MVLTKSEILEKYLLKLGKIRIEEGNNQKYADYLLKIAQLSEILTKYSTRNEEGFLPVLDDTMLEELRRGYTEVFKSADDFKQILTEDDKGNPYIAGRLELMDDLGQMLGQDINIISGVIGSQGKNLEEITDQARNYRVDVTGQNVSVSGANLSSRIPVTFEDRNGQTLTGFFTEDSYSEKSKEFNDLYFRAIDGHPEFERAFLGLMNDQYFRGCFGDTSSCNEYLKKELEKDDLKKTFQDYVWQLLPDRKKGETELIKQDEAEMQQYIDSISKDETFALRMIDFCREYAMITNKYNILEKSARIENGSNIDERNAAMSTMGDLLGVSKLLARSVKMQVINNGEVKNGVFMEFADGSDLMHTKSGDPLRDANITALDSPDAFKSIADLQVLDYICGNVDRHAGNMFYKFKDTPQGTKLDHVTGIDNDCSFGLIETTRYNGVQRMVGTDSMMVVSESMAAKIMAMTPDILKVTLNNYTLSGQEIEAAWKRVDDMKRVITEGVDYYEKNPGAKPHKGHVKIVKDDEWKDIRLAQLAFPEGTLPGTEDENMYGNYFSTVYSLPAMVKSAIKEVEDKKEYEQKLGEKHPQLAQKDSSFTIAQGVILNDNNPEGIRYNNMKLDTFEEKFKAVEKNVFFGSSKFEDIKSAFETVKKLSEKTAPGAPVEDLKKLQDAYSTLLEKTDIYISKKEKEAQKKELGAKSIRRKLFAEELKKFTKDRITGLDKLTRPPVLTGEARKAGLEHIGALILNEMLLREQVLAKTRKNPEENRITALVNTYGTDAVIKSILKTKTMKDFAENMSVDSYTAFTKNHGERKMADEIIKETRRIKEFTKDSAKTLVAERETILPDLLQ